MTISRRQAIGLMAAAVPAGTLTQALAQTEGITFEKGPFQPTRESLKAWQVPEWYKDAKFGIWSHWGPQSATEYGDWYARNMYMQGSHQYEIHLKKYGHPSKFGFKDVIPTWKAEKFDPNHLMEMYKKAGAKYFFSMGVHHDNFDLWNSKHQPRWNAVAAGPKKDIVGLWRKAALKQGLKFGVSEHLSNSYNWFSVSHGSDKTGPFAGVPYDGADPKFADLYHDRTNAPPGSTSAMGRVAPDSWKRQWLLRIKDLLDNYQPDLLYTDGGIPFEEYGLNLLAHYYNSDAKRHGGKVQAVFTSKDRKECLEGVCVMDIERGVAASLLNNYWQTDTCIGNWHYNVETKYKSPKIVLDMLVDIVARNGNLLLNFPLPGSGALDPEELKILDEITKWMAVNSEGIYATRPWKIFGDGPVAETPPGRGMNENSRKDMTAEDGRFTSKGKILYAFVMGVPDKEALVPSLATSGPASPPKILNVELLGFKSKLQWTQDASALKVQLPVQKPCNHALALKITSA